MEGFCKVWCGRGLQSVMGCDKVWQGVVGYDGVWWDSARGARV
jgi:hypothetical protein